MDRGRAREAARGALAGAGAALAWAGAEPISRALLRTPYSDVRLLGGMVVRRGAGWRLAGLGLHVANGALFGAVFAALGGRGWRHGVVAAQIENAVLWPGMALADLLHPDVRSGEWPRLLTDGRVAAHEVLMHGVFGAVLGALLEQSGPLPEQDDGSG